MDFQPLGLIALLGFLCPSFAFSIIEDKNLRPGDLRPGSRKRKIVSLLNIIGIFCCLIMVLQGIHIWGNWEGVIDANNAETFGKTAAKARGKGSIIVLALQFLPQFLVFGYGLWGAISYLSLRHDHSQDDISDTNRGDTKYQSSGSQDAMNDYSQIPKSNLQNASAYFNRGLANVNLGDYQGAKEDLSKAIKLDPKDATSFNNRGNIKYKLGDVQGAIQNYFEAIKINPQHASAYINRGLAKKELKDLKGACEDWEKAAELGNENAAKFLKEHCE